MHASWKHKILRVSFDLETGLTWAKASVHIVPLSLSTSGVLVEVHSQQRAGIDDGGLHLSAPPGQQNPALQVDLGVAGCIISCLLMFSHTVKQGQNRA